MISDTKESGHESGHDGPKASGPQAGESGHESGHRGPIPGATTKPPGPRPRPRKPGVLDRIKSAVALAGRALEFGFYHVILSTVDRVSRLPRVESLNPAQLALATTLLDRSLWSNSNRSRLPNLNVGLMGRFSRSLLGPAGRGCAARLPSTARRRGAP